MGSAVEVRLAASLSAHPCPRPSPPVNGGFHPGLVTAASPCLVPASFSENDCESAPVYRLRFSRLRVRVFSSSLRFDDLLTLRSVWCSLCHMGLYYFEFEFGVAPLVSARGFELTKGDYSPSV